MLDRESTFADPQIVQMLRTDFVPVAIDQAYQRRQKDTEGDFYRQIAGQGPRSDFKATTQGFYIATPSGSLLLYNNNRDPEKVLRRMKERLQQFATLPQADRSSAPITAKSRDPRWDVRLPEGALTVRVRGKVLGGYEPTNNRWRKIFQEAVSRDNLWISAAEEKELTAGNWPKSLGLRLARFHLLDATRGEPLMWTKEDVRSIEIQFDGNQLQLTGEVRLESGDGDRGYQCNIKGIVESDGDRLTRFDVVAKGLCWGDGPYTGGGPKGKFPLALAFELADGKDPADAIPPQGCKGWPQGYMQSIK